MGHQEPMNQVHHVTREGASFSCLFTLIRTTQLLDTYTFAHAAHRGQLATRNIVSFSISAVDGSNIYYGLPQ